MDVIEQVGCEIREVLWKTLDPTVQTQCRVPVGCERPHPEVDTESIWVASEGPGSPHGGSSDDDDDDESDEREEREEREREREVRAHERGEQHARAHPEEHHEHAKEKHADEVYAHHEEDIEMKQQ
jgi:hypothetical protein